MFYLGPYGIKFAFADVNSLTPQIEELHYYTKSNIPYKHTILYSNKKITETVINKGIRAIEAHKQNLRLNFPPETKIHYSGVATHIFLEASNGMEFLDYIYQVTGIKINVVTPIEELKIKYDSIIAALGHNKSRQVLVWNSGKENMHIITKSEEDYNILEVKPSYEEFNTLLKQEFQRDVTLNPINEQEKNRALELALASIAIPESLYKHLQTKTTVVGTGPIHNYVVQHYVNFEKIQHLTNTMSEIDLWEYNLEDIEKAIHFLLNKPNNEIINFMYNKKGYHNVDKEVSNLILVYAVMCKLGIQKIQTINSKNIFGLLLQK